jgi:restriction system protein
MAQFETILTNKHTGEQCLVKSNDRITFDDKCKKRIEKWEKERERQDSLTKADKATGDARQAIAALESLLSATHKVDDRIDWETLKDKKEHKAYTPSPKPNLSQFVAGIPKQSFFEFIGSIKEKRLSAERAASQAYQGALEKWTLLEEKSKKEFGVEKEKFEKVQQLHNQSIDTLKKDYEQSKASAVQKYINMVLERSQYPESLDNMFVETHFVPESKLLIVDMDLPGPEKIPDELEFKYVPSKKDVIVKKMKKKEFESFYMRVVFQIVLRTLHEVFESDYSSSIDLVVFNGWVDGTNKQTGQSFRNCIATLQVTRDEFIKINLEKVEPQECFRHLKGVTAGSLVELAPVKPIMKMDKNDKRIIKAENVLDGFEGSRNLATMDWAEFEVLIRDLVQKEFSHEGCQVEVTRASRDAGVDAIAFDEDPIRGGKFVIQAKRYNNLVPLSAVRDLFGTVHNEGAVKGILVTTSYYGKDALEFVKNKPLTLINGEELLYMFKKYGYQLKIELQKKGKAISEKTY